jgi:hypothetical protein
MVLKFVFDLLLELLFEMVLKNAKSNSSINTMHEILFIKIATLYLL